MSNLDKAVETQLKNIQMKSGKSLAELTQVILDSSLTKHSEIRSMLIDNFGLSYGDANTLVHYALKSDGERAAEEKNLSGDDLLTEIYAGPKSSLRPIHEQLMAQITEFGEFDQLPKKGYVSLRRKKQFAMIGPATNTRVEVGINIKNLEPDARLLEQPAGSMCNYKVRITDPAEVDEQLIDWIRSAYVGAG